MSVNLFNWVFDNIDLESINENTNKNVINELFMKAIILNKPNSVRILISKGADVNMREGFALCHCAENNYINIFELLLQNKADINVRDNYCLCHSVRRHFVDIVKLCLMGNADVNADNGYPLCRAAENGDNEIVIILLQNKADININYGNALCKSINNGHVSTSKLLILNGINYMSAIKCCSDNTANAIRNLVIEMKNNKEIN